MSRRQRLIVYVALFVLLVMCLVPPWYMQYKSFNREAGYGLIFNPPQYSVYVAKIHVARLLLQILALAILTVLAFAISGTRSRNTPSVATAGVNGKSELTSTSPPMPQPSSLSDTVEVSKERCASGKSRVFMASSLVGLVSIAFFVGFVVGSNREQKHANPFDQFDDEIAGGGVGPWSDYQPDSSGTANKSGLNRVRYLPVEQPDISGLLAEAKEKASSGSDRSAAFKVLQQAYALEADPLKKESRHLLRTMLASGERDFGEGKYPPDEVDSVVIVDFVAKVNSSTSTWLWLGDADGENDSIRIDSAVIRQLPSHPESYLPGRIVRLKAKYSKPSTGSFRRIESVTDFEVLTK